MGLFTLSFQRSQCIVYQFFKLSVRTALLKSSLFILTLVCTQVSAQIVTPFAPRYQAEQRGGIVYLSNNILTAGSRTWIFYPSPSSAQNQSPPGSFLSAINDYYKSEYIDIDGDASTFNSSSADLTVANFPACSEVTFAGLYWGGSADINLTRNTVKLKVPGGTYTSVTADANFGHYTDDDGNEHYQYFKDITSLVNNNSEITGTYTVANVVTTEDKTKMEAGWTIVLVYKNENKPFRDLTVFDGLAGIQGTNTVDIPISGFTTPPVGPVKFELGFVAYEGDRGIDGDFLQFNGTTVSDDVHNDDNTFNSSITYDGAVVTTRSPAYRNTLGYDASIIMPDNTALNYIGNSATSANVKLNTDGDFYVIGVVSTSIDVYNPFYKFIHTYSNITNPGATPTQGDVLELVYEVENSGNDASKLTAISDTLPKLFQYVPNSLVKQNSDGTWPSTASYTDASGDDQAEYNASSHKVVFRLGTGANALSGGTVASGTKIAVKVRVKITDDCDELRCSNGPINNDAIINYFGNINSTTAGSNRSGPSYADCFVTGQTVIPLNVPASCLAPPSDVTRTIGCELGVNKLNLSSGFLLYAQSDAGFSTPLTSVSATGTYIARKVVSGGCEYKYNVAIVVDPLILTETHTNILCFGNNTGAIDLSVSGGTAPFTYSWSNSVTAQDLTTLVAGTYSVSVTDSNGCIASKSIVVTQPAAALSASYTQTNVSCQGENNGAFKVNVSGGTTPYMYTLNGTTVTTETFSGLAPGNYTVTVTDANECTTTTIANVITNPLPAIFNVTGGGAYCASGSGVLVGLSGSESGVSYQLQNNGSTIGSPVSGTGSAISFGMQTAAGTYTVVAANATTGCTSSMTGSVSVTINPLPSLFNVIGGGVYCFGTAGAPVGLSGSEAGVNYQLQNNGSNIGSIVAGTGSSISFGLQQPAGTYTVVATNSFLCSVNMTGNVTVTPTAAISGTAAITQAYTCLATGTVQAQTVSGGTAPYQYSIDGTTFGSSDTFTGLTNGTYTITIKDAAECTFVTNSVTLDALNPPTDLTFAAT
ncbi:MAG TPA: SprB repeat-containing protein, partial [Sphingobacteriaceae bacterium]